MLVSRRGKAKAETWIYLKGNGSKGEDAKKES